MIKYVAKPNTWFDEGSEVSITLLYSDMVLACGLHNGKIDEEVCGIDEFEKVEE